MRGLDDNSEIESAGEVEGGPGNLEFGRLESSPDFMQEEIGVVVEH